MMNFSSINITIILLCGLFVMNCKATVDLSNVNLLDFKYFKHDPNNGHHPSLPPLPPAEVEDSHSNIKEQLVQTILEPITNKVQKAKSVATYFKNVFLGNPEHKVVRIIKFDPHFGDAWHPYYEHYYGPKGQYLIESLGKGYHPTLHYTDHHYDDHHLITSHHKLHHYHDHGHHEFDGHHIY